MQEREKKNKASMRKSDHQCLLEFQRDAVSVLHKQVAFGSHKPLENDFFERVCVSAVTSIWICHARPGNRWRVASTRYTRKMYMEPTGGKVKNNLTFKISQASQKAEILTNFVR